MRAAILGLGERGRHWVETCRNAGWDVRVFDPEGKPKASDKRRMKTTISETVDAADWIICCLPERLELLQMVAQRAQAAGPDAAIMAVTSRVHTVDDVQSCAIRPSQMFLLKHDETGEITLEASDRNDQDLCVRAQSEFAQLGRVEHHPDAESA